MTITADAYDFTNAIETKCVAPVNDYRNSVNYDIINDQNNLRNFTTSIDFKLSNGQMVTLKCSLDKDNNILITIIPPTPKNNK
jgi:hypothetical protein